MTEAQQRSRILKNRWFEKFARKEGIDDGALVEAVKRVEAGLVDADLGGGVVKQRVARAGEGKSGGFRTILFFRQGRRTVFVFGFAKKDKANLTTHELATYRKAARLVLDLDDDAIAGEIAAGRMMEVERDGQDLPK